MATGSQTLTTYYAKRIIGDSAANTAATALLQTGTGVTTTPIWILSRTNRATNYGIRYTYNATNGDKIEFVGGNPSATKAWIKLDTGDASFSGTLTVDGVSTFNDYINVFPSTGNNYNQGIRIHNQSDWTLLMLCASDNTGNTGTSANSWLVGNKNGDFYITKNGAATSSSAILKCESNVWSWNGTANGNISGSSAAVSYTVPAATWDYSKSSDAGSDSRDLVWMGTATGGAGTFRLRNELTDAGKSIGRFQIRTYNDSANPTAWGSYYGIVLTASRNNTVTCAIEGNTSISGNLTLFAAKSLIMTYSSTNYEVVKNHNNGNVTLNACGSVLYMGYQNTTSLNFMNGKATMNSTGKLLINPISTAYATSYGDYLEIRSGYTDDTSWAVALKNVYNANATGYGTGIKLSLGSETETGKWAGIRAYAGTAYANKTYLDFYSVADLRMQLTDDRLIPAATDTYYLGDSTHKWKTIYGDLSGNALTATDATNATNAKYFMNRGDDTVTFVDTLWNHGHTPSGHTNRQTVWHQGWKQSGITYTPSGGSATNLTDYATLIYWLSSSDTSNSLQLNMAIDGDIYTTGKLKTTGGIISRGAIEVQNSAANPQITFRSSDGTGAGTILLNMAQTNSVYRVDRFYLREYSYNSTSGATLSYYENYRLPAVTAGLSSNATYEILTSKVWTYNRTSTGQFLYVQQNSVTCGQLSLATLGPANTEGWCTLYLGNSTASTAANNASGRIYLYNKNGGSAYLDGQYVSLGGTNRSAIRTTYFYGSQIWNAVWNDYAECRNVDTDDRGYCVTETPSGQMVKTTKRLQAGCKITSDTYGTCMGQTDEAKTPIAVSGRVLVYPYRHRANYKLGAAVCSAPGGTVDIMTREEIMQYPERIVGTVSEIPTYEVWHGGFQEGNDDVQVNGRIWIYVR